MTLAKTVRVNELYDLYHSLLTPYQQEIFELYYREDYSLQEVAALKGVSRNAVSLLLKRVINSLETYEKKLQLLIKNMEIFNLLNSSSTLEDLKIGIRNILESEEE